ncbi:hypothetical protein G6F24_017313 [Rhizopus arrhizus]|nr:hypothetical protein G6F24_017313 [Rhizopus arrhizus]
MMATAASTISSLECSLPTGTPSSARPSPLPAGRPLPRLLRGCPCRARSANGRCGGSGCRRHATGSAAPSTAASARHRRTGCLPDARAR